jgi:flagellar basal-body rod protein FlgC
MDLVRTMRISAAGMAAQGTRLRVIAENLANSDSTAQVPGGEPYRRKVVTFRSVFDQSVGASTVKIGRVSPAAGDFERKYDPSHPAADADGYVLVPNVNPLIETMDMREAQRSYQANLSVIEVAKSMLGRTLDLLHG